jgi:undecaprenyl diphosphate synthase
MICSDMRDYPRHVAIIMDGNGRWAKKRGLPRTAGHKQGMEAVKRTLDAAREIGINYLTLFGFSSENWLRPPDEVNELMGLLRLYLRSETAELHKKGIRLRVIGDRSRFSPDIQEMVCAAEILTADNTQFTLSVALSYGGREELLRATKKLAARISYENLDINTITEQNFASFLDTDGIPDPDLLIRTSGEQRISNFLLWQCAYSELFFSKTLWPDFSKQDMNEAIEDYLQRDRRFGKIAETC